MKRLMLWRLYASRSESSSTFERWRRPARSPVDQAEKALHAGSLMSGRRRWALGKEMRPDRESFQDRHRGQHAALSVALARQTFANAHCWRFGGGAVLLRMLILGWNWTCR
jgi:hypothetical protein